MRGFLRSIWNAPALPTTSRSWRDWTAVALFAVIITIETAHRSDLPWHLVAGAVTFALLPTLLWRRTHPLTMLVIAFTATTLVSVLIGPSQQLGSNVYLLAMPFALFRWGSGRSALGGIGVMGLSLVVEALLSPTPLADVIGGLTASLAVLGIATALRFRAVGRVRALENAATREREHLARDLHDTVAHHVSAIAIRAQAGLATAATDPGAATEALRLIEGEASRALAEMRALVRELRQGDPAERAPGAGLAELRALATASGELPRVTVDVDAAAESLSATIAGALYRIAREAVTNARRHAREPRLVAIRVSVADGTATLTVRDDGGQARHEQGGFGIAGMVERALLLGGECAAGPAAEGGWLVRATLPTRGVAR